MLIMLAKLHSLDGRSNEKLFIFAVNQVRVSFAATRSSINFPSFHDVNQHIFQKRNLKKSKDLVSFFSLNIFPLMQMNDFDQSSFDEMVFLSLFHCCRLFY